jgi:hypothetical protein
MFLTMQEHAGEKVVRFHAFSFEAGENFSLVVAFWSALLGASRIRDAEILPIKVWRCLFIDMYYRILIRIFLSLRPVVLKCVCIGITQEPVKTQPSSVGLGTF